MFGVLDAHEREMVEEVELPTMRFPGAVGAVATCTVVVRVEVPFAFVAVKVYIVVVESAGVVVDPMRVLVANPPGVIVTELAFETFQERVAVPFKATTPGEAVKAVIEGMMPEGIVNVALLEVTVPPLFVANAWKS